MRESRLTEELIMAVLNEAEAGAMVTGLCRTRGISARTSCCRRMKYGGLELSEARLLRQLRGEGACL